MSRQPPTTTAPPPNTTLSQKRLIEINHALSGVHGPTLQQRANKITQSRKQIIRRLERKKKHSNILHDQLYQYLRKFPEEKSSLEQQVLIAKKNPILDFEAHKKKHEVPYVELGVKEGRVIREEMGRLERLGEMLGGGREKKERGERE